MTFRNPHPHTRDIALIGAGLAGGALAMFLLDPRSGRRRVARLRQRGGSLMRQAGVSARRRTRDIAHRALGALAETRRSLRWERVETEVLLGRLRAELGHICSAPGEVAIAVHDGYAVLSGVAPRSEATSIANRLARVPGVKGLECRLRLRDSTLPGGPIGQTASRAA